MITVSNGYSNGNAHGNVTLTALLRRVKIVNVTSRFCNVTSRVHDNNVILTVYYILPYKYKHIITSASRVHDYNVILTVYYILSYVSLRVCFLFFCL